MQSVVPQARLSIPCHFRCYFWYCLCFRFLSFVELVPFFQRVEHLPYRLQRKFSLPEGKHPRGLNDLVVGVTKRLVREILRRQAHVECPSEVEILVERLLIL